MAEVLDVNQMLSNNYEPKRQFRWIIDVDGLDAYNMKSSERPKIDTDEVVIDWMNTKWYLAGKSTPQTMNVVFYDPIAPSASQKIMEWLRLCYEYETGRAGYASFYKRDFDMKLLDGPGAVVEKWKFKGAWVKGVDFGALNYASNDPVEITATLRYDWAQLAF